MTLANRREWQKDRVGRLHLTIEAEPPASAGSPMASGLSFARHQELHDTTRELASVLADCDLRATWAVGDPAHSAVTAVVAESRASHEMALLGDCHWFGRTAGRKRFAHELARRLAQARAAGIDLVTLVPRVAPVVEHLDLIVKHGIRVVVGFEDARSRSARGATPRMLHYGVWEVLVTGRLPQRVVWLPGACWSWVRAIRRAGPRAATVHWLIDSAAMARQGPTAMKRIAGVLRHVADLRDQGVVRVETLREAADRLSDLPAATPLRSILRAA